MSTLRLDSAYARGKVLMRLRYALISLAVLAACNDSTPDDGEPDDRQLDDEQASLTLPPDFVDRNVAAVPGPTALAFTPDGRLLVTTQLGTVRVIVNGQLRAQAALDLGTRLCTNSERGLLGIAVDPQFAQNSHIYLYYTFRKFNSCVANQIGTSPVNRVSRFTYNQATDTIAPASEVVLVDNILSLNGNHNGGDIHVGADGMLYVAVGDSGCQIGGGNCAGGNANARFRSHLSGKILRVNRSDGTPPSDNPFFNLAGARRCGTAGTPPDYPNNDSKPCREIWSYGLRNPFRFAFQPGTSNFFINDVGQNVAEEIDENVKGANYGWNQREGFCANGQTCTPGAPPAGLTNPIFAYGRAEGCASITGGAFVPAGAWSPAFDGDYLFADFVCGKIFRLERSGATVSVTNFATELGGSSVVAMRFGPGPTAAPSLYYTTFQSGGSVRRIEFTGAGANDAPTAVINATPTSGPLPLAVAFNGAASSDPDPGDSITTYRWTFGDGATQDTTAPTVSHTYTVGGPVTASLRVVDELGATSTPATIPIVPGGAPPTVTMTNPTATATFRVGQVVTLSATASDPQDGTLPATALSWTVLKRHADHAHSFFGPTRGNNLSITTDPPEDVLGATNSFLEVRVTATDSSGLSTTVVRNFQPTKVNLSFQTVPPGLSLILDNTFTRVAPATIVAWQDWRLALSAPDQVLDGVSYVFQSWSDGGARDHTIVAPGAPATFTATFVPANRFTARVNFQPATAAVPAGYVADSGAAFGARGNGLTYGWNLATDETRDRDSANSPDQRFDTLNHMQKPSNPTARWEIAVPNGTYQVRIVSGDPANIDSVFRIAAESTLVVDGTPTTTARWVDGTSNVTVSDGRLTLSSAAGAANNKLCFIELTQL
jgi:glucose/arabinose dehydrogenase